MAKRFGVLVMKSDGRSFQENFDTEDEALTYVGNVQELAPDMKCSITDRKTGDLNTFDRKLDVPETVPEAADA